MFKHDESLDWQVLQEMRNEYESHIVDNGTLHPLEARSKAAERISQLSTILGINRSRASAIAVIAYLDCKQLVREMGDIKPEDFHG